MSHVRKLDAKDKIFCRFSSLRRKNNENEKNKS